MAGNTQEALIFEIREHLGVIAKKKNGWSRELNIVCWNNQEPPKFDVRDWSEDHKHMTKGITMYADEMRRLFVLYMDWCNQRVVGTAQEKRRKEEAKYQKQRTRMNEQFSSEQKVVSDVPNPDPPEEEPQQIEVEEMSAAGVDDCTSDVDLEAVTPAEQENGQTEDIPAAEPEYASESAEETPF